MLLKQELLVLSEGMRFILGKKCSSLMCCCFLFVCLLVCFKTMEHKNIGGDIRL